MAYERKRTDGSRGPLPKRSGKIVSVTLRMPEHLHAILKQQPGGQSEAVCRFLETLPQGIASD